MQQTYQVLLLKYKYPISKYFRNADCFHLVLYDITLSNTETQKSVHGVLAKILSKDPNYI